MTAGRRAILWMAAFGAAWAGVDQLGSLLSQTYSAYQVVWSRYAAHLLFMLALWGWRDPRSLWRTQRPAYQVARSLLMIGMPASFILSLQHGIDPGVLWCIFWTCPLLMLAIARVWLRESAPATVWVSAFAATAGACIAFGGGQLPHARLLVLPAGMAITFSAYVAMTRSLRTESTRANLFYTALGVFIPLSFVMPRLWITPTPHDVLVLAGIGVIGYCSLLALDRMTVVAPVANSAPVAPLQLVFSAGFTSLLGGPHLGYGMMLGSGIVAASAIFLWAHEPLLAVLDAA